MADFNEHIKIIIESVSDVTGIKAFKTAVHDADGVVGKFKAGASSAFETLKAHAGTAAIVAGAALVKFGLDSSKAFDDMAVAARNLAVATGLTVEQASRWIGAAKDMGVSADLLFHGMAQIAKHIDDDVWAKWGIQVRDAAGEMRPINDILLDAAGLFDSLGTEQEKAAAGEQLFRRGYRTLAPLFEQGKAALEGYLGAVEKGQVITSSELAKAQEDIRAKKDLGQAVHSLGLEFGQFLTKVAPAIVVVAKFITTVVGGITGVTGFFFGIDKGTQAFQDFFKVTAQGGGSIKKIGDELKGMVDASQDAHGFFRSLTTDLFNSRWDDVNEQVKKMGKESPAAVMDVVDSLKALKDQADAGDESAKKLVKDYELTDEHLKQLAGYSVPALTDAMGQAEVAAKQQAEAEQDLKDRETEVKEATSKHTEEVQAANKAAADYAETLDTYIKRMDEIKKAHLDAVGASEDFDQTLRDLDSSYYDLTGKIEENTKTQKDHHKDDGEKEQSTRDLATAQHELAAGVLDASGKYAESKGAIDGSAAAIKAQIDFLNLSKAKYPELTPIIDGYIAKLTAIPTDIKTRVSVTGHLDSIIIDGETHAAGTVNIIARTNVIRTATGTPNYQGGFTTLNESGREAVALPPGTKVIGASQTANGEMGVGTQQASYLDQSTTIINLPPGINPDAVAYADRNYRRRGGR